MSDRRIDPERVTKPIQLLAAWLVFVIVLDGSFLAAAAAINHPAWAPGLLTIAAIVNVPLLLVFIYVLQTRFRPELQADSYYSGYLREQRRLTVLSQELRSSLNAGGLGFKELASGRSIDDVPSEIRTDIESRFGIVAEFSTSC